MPDPISYVEGAPSSANARPTRSMKSLMARSRFSMMCLQAPKTSAMQNHLPEGSVMLVGWLLP